MKIEHVSTELKLAKSLGRVKFEEISGRIGTTKVKSGSDKGVA